eukprot:TRINITY_DN4784_c0_g1_i1.p1 TRINITY_DN4784_c0_g1~~TRINITY_DN4784_c0_g1_i1.p1  ORF type:complete len:294 (-),score=102.34 TRINITY_DN4784_c0_g1_i1:142-1023(-)
MWIKSAALVALFCCVAAQSPISDPCFANGASGVCLNKNETKLCDGEWVAGVCPGDDAVVCCLNNFGSCSAGALKGTCQSMSAQCDGVYHQGLCSGSEDVQCCLPSAADPPALVAAFADKNWNCADVACTTTVPAGSAQPNYECAEFVSRSLAAGGYIPGLTPTAPQSEFGSYSYKGKTYDLLWVSSQQGPPLGLQDFLGAAGWVQVGSAQAATVVFVDGSGGPYTHVAVGVAANTLDAHNMARYHEPTSFYTVNSMYAAGSVPTGSADEAVDVVPAGGEEDVLAAKLKPIDMP